MKKILYACWTGRFLDDDKLCHAILQYRNTPSRKDGLSPAQKLLILDIHSKIFFQLTTIHSYLNGSIPLPQLSNNDKIPYSHLLPFTTLMPTHYLTSTLDHMLPFRIHKPRLGIFTVLLLKLAHNAAITLRPKGEKY